MKYFVKFFILVLLLIPIAAPAEVKEIICEGTYNMGDGETPGVAESRALLNAKRLAVEQAGTYVESYSKVKNFQLTADEVKIMASGVMEVTVLDKKRTVVGEGFHFWVKIKALVNSDRMDQMAGKVKERTIVEDYKRIKTAYDKSQTDIEELKKQLLLAKGDRKKEVEGKIAGDEKRFQANEWYEKAVGYYNRSIWSGAEWNKALEAFTAALALDPQNGQAYSYRGHCYIILGDFDRAISDYKKALSLCDVKCQEKDEYSLLYRVVDIGNRYAGMNEHHKAIETYTMLIQGIYDRYNYDPLYKEMTNIYYNRGNSYSAIGQYGMAIRDYDTALTISINVRDVQSRIYLNRGVACYREGNLRRALPDFQKACELGQPKGCSNAEIVSQQLR